MAKPTGKLKNAYETISIMEKKIKAFGKYEKVIRKEAYLLEEFNVYLLGNPRELTLQDWLSESLTDAMCKGDFLEVSAIGMLKHLNDKT